MTAELARLVSRVARTVRTVIGAPDYDHYLAHLRERHLDEKPLSHAEFANQRMNDRYSRPGSRCC